MRVAIVLLFLLNILSGTLAQCTLKSSIFADDGKKLHKFQKDSGKGKINFRPVVVVCSEMNAYRNNDRKWPSFFALY